MSQDLRRARDLKLLDRIDAHARRPFTGIAWRVVRDGRDPLEGGRPISRWCNGEFDILYTSLERDGAIAEIHALLDLQPVFPSQIAFQVKQLTVSVRQALDLSNLSTLSELGLDTDRFREREYGKSQEIADAAYFLGFDGLIVPNARWPCSNLILFTDRIGPACLALKNSEPIDWRDWLRRRRG